MEQPNAKSNCGSLPLVGMAELFPGLRRFCVGGWRRFWRECGAVEIAEAAFVFPILFMFIFAILQFGRVYLVYSTMQRAAEAAAKAATSSTCATCASANYELPADVLATTIVAPIFQNAHVDLNALTVPATPSRNACSGAAVACDGLGTGATPKICVQRNVILNEPQGGGSVPASGTAVCGTAVSLAYPLTFSLPSMSATPPYVSRQVYALNLKAQAQVKGEN